MSDGPIPFLISRSYRALFGVASALLRFFLFERRCPVQFTAAVEPFVLSSVSSSFSLPLFFFYILSAMSWMDFKMAQVCFNHGSDFWILFGFQDATRIRSSAHSPAFFALRM
jgi:hypothetical protein